MAPFNILSMFRFSDLTPIINWIFIPLFSDFADTFFIDTVSALWFQNLSQILFSSPMYLHYDSEIICRYFSSHRTHTNTSSTSLSVIMQIHLTLQMYPQFHFFQCCRYIPSKKCILNFTFSNVADTFRQKNVSSTSLFPMLQILFAKTQQ